MKYAVLVLALVTASCGGQTVGPPPGYYGYTGLAIIQAPSVPNMGTQTKSGLAWYDPSYPTGSPSKVVRCTDQSLMASTNPNLNKSAGLSGSGSAQWLFNANSTMLHFNDSGGHQYLTLFNPTTMVCGDPITGHAITADKNLTNPGSATTVYAFSSGSFSATDPSIYYVSGGGGGFTDFTGATVGSYTFNTSNGTFTVNPVILDYQYALPFATTNAPAWTTATSYATGQYVSYALNSTQAPDWTPSFSGYVLGDIIHPLTNNPLGCGFKLTQTGTTAAIGSEPTWSTTGVCLAASNSQITDGTAKWRNLGGPPTFAYQLTGANCTSGAAFPLSGHPDLISTVTDNTCIWTNSGLAFGAGGAGFSGVSRNGKRFCGEFSNNFYGYAAAGGQSYQNANGAQGTGFMVVCYDVSVNTYYLVNLATGIQSVITCGAGGTGFNCFGGQFSMATQGTLSTIGTCGIFVHNSRASTGMDYVEIQRQTSMAGSSGCPSGDGYDWLPFQAFNTATSLQVYGGTLNHWATGFNHLINIGQTNGSNCIQSPAAGGYSCIYDSANTANATQIDLVISPCSSSWVGDGTDTIQPCGFGSAYDSHLSWAYNPYDLDNTPVCGTVFNQSGNIGTVGFPLIVAPWEQEEVCISTTPTATVTSSPLGTVWRFTHTFQTMTCATFDCQFGISQVSTDGHFIAFSSDWFCTLGDTSGGPSPRCGLPWRSNFAYALNALISPIGALNGTGSKYDVFQITNMGSGTSGTSFPGFANPNLAFGSCTGVPGCFVTDNNGVVYTRLGASNGKGEVFIVQTSPYTSTYGNGRSIGMILQ